MTTVYRYRIFCITEGQFVTGWGTSPPTKCYNNTADTVNPDSVGSPIDSITEQKVAIANETVPQGFPPTGGNYKCDCFEMSCDPSTVTTKDLSHPMPVCINTIQVFTQTENIGDYITVTAGPNTIIGLIPSDVSVGATSIPFAPQTLPYLSKGYYLKLTDGSNFDSLGRILAIDSANMLVTVEIPTVHAFSAASPTEIMTERRVIDNFRMTVAGEHNFGTAKLGSAYLPVHTIVRVAYTNSTASQKLMVSPYEYYY